MHDIEGECRKKIEANSLFSAQDSEDFKNKLKKIKCIVCDLDGTLLNEKGSLSALTVQTIKRLQKAGYLFTIATGRLSAMTRLFVDELQLDMPVIACNGAVVGNILKNKVYFEDILRQDIAQQLLDLYMELNLDFLMYTNNTKVDIYHRENSKRLKLHLYHQKMCEAQGSREVSFSCLDDINPNELKTFLKDNNLEVLKFYVTAKDEKLVKQAFDMTVKINGVYAVQSWNNSFDVMKDGINKGVGLRRLAEILKLEPENFACFGDQDNDKEMLKLGGISYAMKNGELSNYPFVDSLAEPNYADGVARAILQDFLNR